MFLNLKEKLFELIDGTANICCFIIGTNNKIIKKYIKKKYNIKSNSGLNLEFIRIWSTLIIKIELKINYLLEFNNFLDQILQTIRNKCSNNINIIVEYVKSNQSTFFKNKIRSIMKIIIDNEFDNIEGNTKKLSFGIV